MTISLPATADETTEILRFLHRFADLMSTGNNSDNLLRAARMLESHVDLLKEAEALLQEERIRLQEERARSEAAAEIQKTLEEQIGEFEGAVTALRSQLSDQELHATMVVADMEARQSKLLERADEAEASLAELQNKPSEIPFGSIAVPLAALRLAKGQFESLARTFEKSGDIISQVMCQASASSLERVMLDSGAAESDDPPHHEIPAPPDRNGLSAVH